MFKESPAKRRRLSPTTEENKEEEKVNESHQEVSKDIEKTPIDLESEDIIIEDEETSTQNQVQDARNEDCSTKNDDAELNLNLNDDEEVKGEHNSTQHSKDPESNEYITSNHIEQEVGNDKPNAKTEVMLRENTFNNESDNVDETNENDLNECDVITNDENEVMPTIDEENEMKTRDVLEVTAEYVEIGIHENDKVKLEREENVGVNEYYTYPEICDNYINIIAENSKKEIQETVILVAESVLEEASDWKPENSEESYEKVAKNIATLITKLSAPLVNRMNSITKSLEEMKECQRSLRTSGNSILKRTEAIEKRLGIEDVNEVKKVDMKECSSRYDQVETIDLSYESVNSERDENLSDNEIKSPTAVSGNNKLNENIESKYMFETGRDRDSPECQLRELKKKHKLTKPKKMPKAVLDAEWKLRLQRKNVIMAKGLNEDEKEARKLFMEIVWRCLRIDLKIVESAYLRRNVHTFKVDEFAKKKDVLKGKNELKTFGLEVSDFMTLMEKDVMKWIEDEAKIRRAGGEIVQVGYMKISVDGRWLLWDDEIADLKYKETGSLRY